MKDIDQKYFPDQEIDLFHAGEAQKAYEFLGCHYICALRMHRFCVWAPNAQNISVVGDFNDWDISKHPMAQYKKGIWIAFVPNVTSGDNYKYCIHGYDGSTTMKADPFAFYSEVRPSTASKVWEIDGYTWHDEEYLHRRAKKKHIQKSGFYL